MSEEKMKMAILLVAVCLISACGSKEIQPPKSHKPYAFENFTIPGSMDHAKQSGFTNCKPDYGGFLCEKNTKTALEGVPISYATLSLNDNDNFSVDGYFNKSENSGAGKNLSYRSIRLVLPKTTYSDRCLDKIRKKQNTYNIWPYPIECRENDGVDFLRHTLTSKGWVERSGRGGHIYLYRKNTPIQIVFKLDSTDVTLEPIEISAADTSIADVMAKRAEQAAKERNDREVIEAMKTK